MLGLGLIELLIIMLVVFGLTMAFTRRRRAPIVEETIEGLPASDPSNPYAPSNVSRHVVKQPGSRLGLIVLLLFILGLVGVGGLLGFSVAQPVPMPAPVPVAGGSAAPQNAAPTNGSNPE